MFFFSIAPSSARVETCDLMKLCELNHEPVENTFLCLKKKARMRREGAGLYTYLAPAYKAGRADFRAACECFKVIKLATIKTSLVRDHRDSTKFGANNYPQDLRRVWAFYFSPCEIEFWRTTLGGQENFVILKSLMAGESQVPSNHVAVASCVECRVSTMKL